MRGIPPPNTIGSLHDMLDRRQLLKAGTLGGLSAMLTPELRADKTRPGPDHRLRGIVFMVADGMSAGVLSMA